MATRTTLKQLESLAEHVSNVTGKKYQVRASNGSFGFEEVYESTATKDMFNATTAGGLKDCIRAFLSGFSDGLKKEFRDSLPKPKVPGTKKSVNSCLQVYRVTALVAIDQSDMEDDNGNPVSFDESAIKGYLEKALTIDLNDGAQDDVGVQSVEIHPSTMRQLDHENVIELYGTPLPSDKIS